jgi:ferrous iron transport protein B
VSSRHQPAAGLGRLRPGRRDGPVIALAGNPNVGKSTIFNRLTGLHVTTAHYPGTTVEVAVGTAHLDGVRTTVVDLPGSYGLGAASEDQLAARRALLEVRPDVVIVILDATNLARNLYLALELLDLGLPVVVALNLMDEAGRAGIQTNIKRLSEALGVTVIPTVAHRGVGVRALLTAAFEETQAASGSEGGGHRLGHHHGPRYGRGGHRRRHRRGRRPPAPNYGADVESWTDGPLAALEATRHEWAPDGLSTRGLAILLLERDEEVWALARGSAAGQDVLQRVEVLERELGRVLRQPPALAIAGARHSLAADITAHCQRRMPLGRRLRERLWRYATATTTGIPIALAVMAGLLAFLYYVGDFLSVQFDRLWGATASPVLDAVTRFLLPGQAADVLLWGIDAGINASLAIGIPYVLTFYFLLAVLEDTGYLNAVAFLSDSVMRRLGLQGRALVPLIAGAGCNVPAVIGTRILSSRRERLIASTLVVLTPCSARTAVILGSAARFIGIAPAVAILGVTATLVAGTGLALNKLLPGRPGELIMEVFPPRRPPLRTVAVKTWFRFKDFVVQAAPIVIVGSLVMGLLYETDTIWRFTAPLSPVVEDWLGLPAVAGLALVFGILRKELALQFLVALALIEYGGNVDNLRLFMDTRQIFVFALVTTIYFPCLATAAVLGRELGWRSAGAIMAGSIGLAVLVGGVANQVLLRV